MLILYQYSEAFGWATPQTIVGISLVTMVFTGLSSTLAYYKKGRVDTKTGTLFLFGSIPGGIIGSWLNQFIDADSFSLYFGLLMIGLSMLFLIKRKEPDDSLSETDQHVRTFHVNGQVYRYRVSVWLAFFLALGVGMMSGLFGIGGGSIMVPAMILLFGIPAHIAAPTSMFMIFFSSIISSSTHIALGHIAWEYVFFFIPGAYIGGTLGAKVNQMLKGNTLELILRIVLVLIGIRLIFSSLF